MHLNPWPTIKKVHVVNNLGPYFTRNSWTFVDENTLLEEGEEHQIWVFNETGEMIDTDVGTLREGTNNESIKWWDTEPYLT